MIPVAYSPELLEWRLGEGHPTDPRRAQRAVRALLCNGLPVELVAPRAGTLEEMELVHEWEYLEALLGGWSAEWVGRQPRLAEVARLMFGGTMALVDQLLADPAIELAFAPAGAKHHAMPWRSGGFCVLNDIAVAALRLADEGGLRVLYVDWDAHHGDGVEECLRARADIPTLSIHDGTIFPGTGRDGHDPARGVYNWALPAGSGDVALAAALREGREVARESRPDVVLLAAGADGLANDPLASLRYTQKGLALAAREVTSWAPRILVAGAGGYLPLTETPLAWARVVTEIARAQAQARATTFA